ncbi:hypothetical protein AZI09_06710 [Levilactobacillus brevis]|nr:hypothetical protein AZI09_06710 [Levilactobacillus brevis]
MFIILIKANIYTVAVETEVLGKLPFGFSKWPNQTYSFTGQVLGMWLNNENDYPAKGANNENYVRKESP